MPLFYIHKRPYRQINRKKSTRRKKHRRQKCVVHIAHQKLFVAGSFLVLCISKISNFRTRQHCRKRLKSFILFFCFTLKFNLRRENRSFSSLWYCLWLSNWQFFLINRRVRRVTSRFEKTPPF